MPAVRLAITEGLRTETVTCLRTGEKTDVKTCSHCQFLFILEQHYVKCGWTETKEKLLNKEYYYNTN